MGMQFLLLLATTGIAVAGQPPDEALQTEQVKLQGTWVIVGTGLGGIPNPARGVPGITIVGDRISSFRVQKQGNEIVKSKEEEWGTFTIDPSKLPKAIDLKYSSGPNKGKTAKGIYALARREMLLCLGKVGKERPTEKDIEFQPDCYILERARA